MKFNHVSLCKPIENIEQVNENGSRYYVTKDNKKYPSITTVLSEYYKKVIASISQDGPWYHIKKGEWGYYEDLFDAKNESLVFVDINGTVENLLQEFYKIDKNIKNIERRKQIWKNLQNYAINVPQKYMEEWGKACNGLIIDDSIPEVEEFQHGIWLIRQSGIGKIYLKDTGFMPSKKDDLDV